VLKLYRLQTGHVGLISGLTSSGRWGRRLVVLHVVADGTSFFARTTSVGSALWAWVTSKFQVPTHVLRQG